MEGVARLVEQLVAHGGVDGKAYHAGGTMGTVIQQMKRERVWGVSRTPHGKWAPWPHEAHNMTRYLVLGHLK